MTAHIVALTAEQTQTHLPELVALLQDAVDSGASIGFLPPLDAAEAKQYWQSVIADLQNGGRILLIAQVENRIAGTVQLELAKKANSPHRAEVQKLMVHNDFRRRGIGKLLMAALEEVARHHKRTLLVLDTLKGDAAELLYPQIGYIRVGEIPEYVIIGDHSLVATVVFYKILGQ